jgi:hypothetical protein
MADIRQNHGPVQTHHAHEIPSCPKDLPGEVPLPTTEQPGDLDRALTLDAAHHVRNRLLRRNADTHMNMVAHQGTLLLFSIPCTRRAHEISLQDAA